jgi:hypothetical protein
MKKSIKRKSRCSSAPGNPDRSSHGWTSPLRIQASQTGRGPTMAEELHDNPSPGSDTVIILRGRAPKPLAGARDR